MPAPDLPLEAVERLGPYYVYALVDPTDESVFYVGKGSRRRLLVHGREADLVVNEKARSSKVRHIHAVREAGHEPRVDIVRHRLEEPEGMLVDSLTMSSRSGRRPSDRSRSPRSCPGARARHSRRPAVEYLGMIPIPLPPQRSRDPESGPTVAGPPYPAEA